MYSLKFTASVFWYGFWIQEKMFENFKDLSNEQQ